MFKEFVHLRVKASRNREGDPQRVPEARDVVVTEICVVIKERHNCN